jgi:multiple sugar transport system ATP-binding protein
MKLIEGRVEANVFVAHSVRVEDVGLTDDPVTLGFRAEDALLSAEHGEISAPIYSIELLGDATMVTVRIAGTLVSVKARKSYRAEIGDQIHFAAPNSI